MLNYMQIVVKSLDVNWVQLLLSTADGAPKLATQCCMKILAVIVAAVFVGGKTFVSLK